MNISCSTQALATAIDVVSRCLGPRPVKESYGFIQIDADDGVISVSATDGLMYMVANIDASDGDIIDPGVIAMDGKLLAAVIQKQQSPSISLSSDEKSCTIKCGKAKTQLSLRPAEDFPEMPPVPSKSRVAKMAQGDLRACIDYVSFCTSTDQARKVLTGVLMDFQPDTLCMVGLDGFRMAMRRARCEFEGEQIKCVVPKSSAVEIGRLLSDGSESPVTLRMTKEYLHVWVDKFAFSTTLLTGEYIDYRRMIRENCETKALIDSRQLRGCVDRAQVMASAGKNDLIYLRFADQQLFLSSNSMDGAANDEIDIGLQGQPLEIAFNVRYLIDMLKHEPDGQIDMECSGNVSPAVIRPLNDDSRLQLVLPVRLLNGRAAG